MVTTFQNHLPAKGLESGTVRIFFEYFTEKKSTRRGYALRSKVITILADNIISNYLKIIVSFNVRWHTILHGQESNALSVSSLRSHPHNF